MRWLLMLVPLALLAGTAAAQETDAEKQFRH
jgi:hypothetical protein